MADEKKYSAKEAAIEVLKKAKEVLQKHEEMQKAHKHIGWDKLHSKLEHEGYSKESADKIAGSIKAKVHPAHKSEEMNKAQPAGEIHPKEPQAGESEHPGARIESQVAPEANPKEQAEGNNEMPGTTPTKVGNDQKALPGFDEMKGHLKLAKFIGHMESKRKRSVPGQM